MAPRHGQLKRFFSGLAQHTFFTELGMADPPLVDYLSEMLVRFVHLDAVYRIRDLAGRRLEQVGQMLLEAQQRVGDARREIYRHIGDFTLFWTGVYPEGLKRLQAADRLDYFVDYCTQGKRSYWIASTYDDPQYDEQNRVLERLSQHFELCAYGLRQMRREWETAPQEDQPFRGLLLD